MNTGKKLVATVRTCADEVSSANLRCDATLKIDGNCTATISALPTTDPHASSAASRGSDVVPPKVSSVAIIAPFQTTDAEYDSRKRPWLLRTPRHHADITVR